MKKESISFSITLIFIISSLIIVALSVVLIKGNQKRQEFFLRKKAHTVLRIIMKNQRFNNSFENLKIELENFNFSLMPNCKILKNRKKLILKEKHRFLQIKLFLIEDNYYFLFIAPQKDFLLKDNSQIENNRIIVISVFVIILSLFILLFFTTIKKLNLIKELKNKIINLGDGDLNINSATNKNDEISQLLNEFDKSVKKLKNFRESRNVFIRNIMHELKTPITKGKIIAELPPSPKNSEKLKDVFYRMQSLIEEFASIEELISVAKKPRTKIYFLAEIIDNAKDLLLIEDEKVIDEFENLKIDVNFKLFSIAIKNLIDNAVKYSPNSQVIIKTIEEKIIFENSGAGLQFALENYFEPFIKDNESNQSFGLGLYIVKHILDANGYTISYKYEDRINKFILIKKV